MSRKQFAIIAETVRQTIFGTVTKEQREAIALQFADSLEATNDRFDRARFLKACGV